MLFFPEGIDVISRTVDGCLVRILGVPHEIFLSHTFGFKIHLHLRSFTAFTFSVEIARGCNNKSPKTITKRSVELLTRFFAGSGALLASSLPFLSTMVYHGFVLFDTLFIPRNTYVCILVLSRAFLVAVQQNICMCKPPQATLFSIRIHMDEIMVLFTVRNGHHTVLPYQ